MISLIFSAPPDVFWYSILHHHPRCLLLSLSSRPVYLSFCLIKLSASPILLLFFFNLVTYLFFIACLTYLPVSSSFTFPSCCAAVIICNIPCHAFGCILVTATSFVRFFYWTFMCISVCVFLFLHIHEHMKPYILYKGTHTFVFRSWRVCVSGDYCSNVICEWVE